TVEDSVVIELHGRPAKAWRLGIHIPDRRRHFRGCRRCGKAEDRERKPEPGESANGQRTPPEGVWAGIERTTPHRLASGHMTRILVLYARLPARLQAPLLVAATLSLPLVFAWPYAARAESAAPATAPRAAATEAV